MHQSILEALVLWTINIISHLGYSGIFFLMTLESALIPIPSEVIMPFSGFLVAQGRFNLFAVALVGAFGNLFGSWIAYWIGYTKGEKYIRKLVVRYGKFILLTEEEFDDALRAFNKHGQWVAGVSRMLPAVRTIISLPAGIAKLDFWKFSALTFFGSLIWSFTLAYIGFLLGKNWEIIRPYFRKFDVLIVALVAILVIFYIYHKLKKRRISAQKT